MRECCIATIKYDNSDGDKVDSHAAITMMSRSCQKLVRYAASTPYWRNTSGARFCLAKLLLEDDQGAFESIPREKDVV